MLGTPYTGRLPTTQANLDLLKNRIRQVQYQMNTLDQQVARGQIDNRAAGYRRQQLIGEVAELKRKIANSRLSTPSYRVPRDLQKFRGSKPANKMVSESNNDGLPEGYFGTDQGGNHSSITSDWEATAPVTFDIPDVPDQAGFRKSWPNHWPGAHSPLITRAVMEAGEIGTKQILDPRIHPITMKGLNLVNFPPHMETAKVIKARYEELKNIVEADIRFTPTDRTLVYRITSAINLQITEAEQEIERLKAAGGYREFSNAQYREEKVQDHKTGVIMKQTIFWIDGSQPDLVRYWAGDPNLGRVPDPFPTKIEDIASQMYKTPQEARLALDNLYAAAEAKAAANTAGGGKFVRYADIDQRFKLVYTYNPGSPYKTLKLYEQLRNDGKYNYRYFYDDKATFGSNNQQKWNYAERVQSLYQYAFQGQNSDGVVDGHPKVSVVYADGSGGMETYNASGFSGAPSFGLLGMFKRNSRNARRTGTRMGLGSASRNFNAMKADRGISPSQERSLNQARRELTMAKARAGARVDITKQIKEEPVTRPWSLQVSLPPQKIQELHSMIDMALMQTNLNQAMFTQQAHNYVASIINSLSSDMTPTQQTEYVVERIMSEIVNRSALLKRDVKVDIDPTNMGVRFEEQQEQNIEGLGSGLLKTKAAMGRLLG
jgi:hypothetical protein